MGTTGLIQIQDLSDTVAPVGTTGLIRYRTYQIQEYSWVLQNSSNTRVPIGTTELI